MRVEGTRWADVEPARAQGSGESQGKGLEPQVLQLADAREHLLRRPLACDGAALHHDDALGGERVVHEMRDVDDGDAALAETVDAGHDVGSTCGVQHGAGLIEEQRSRPHRQGPRDRHALALSAREIGRVAARLAGDCPRLQGPRRRVPRSAHGTPRKFSDPKATSSSTMLVTIWSSGFCRTSATSRRAARAEGPPCEMSLPAIRTPPASGAIRPFMSWSSVDLPDPLPPSTQSRSPGMMRRLTRSSAGRSAPG